MRRPTYAQTEHKAASLSTPFGLDYATRLFGAEAIASLPVLKAGPNKGKPKGHINWLKTTSAGYHPNMGGGVGVGVVVRAWIAPAGMQAEEAAMQGTWCGRMQSLCGSRGVLGQEARDRDARQRAREAAEIEAYLTERERGA